MTRRNRNKKNRIKSRGEEIIKKRKGGGERRGVTKIRRKGMTRNVSENRDSRD